MSSWTCLNWWTTSILWLGCRRLPASTAMIAPWCWGTVKDWWRESAGARTNTELTQNISHISECSWPFECSWAECRNQDSTQCWIEQRRSCWIPTAWWGTSRKALNLAPCCPRLWLLLRSHLDQHCPVLFWSTLTPFSLACLRTSALWSFFEWLRVCPCCGCWRKSCDAWTHFFIWWNLSQPACRSWTRSTA